MLKKLNIKYIVTLSAFLLSGNAFADRYAFEDKPACRNLPAVKWTKDYITGFLTESIWSREDWKTTTDRNFSRWYQKDLGVMGGTFTKVDKNTFRLLNGDGSIVIRMYLANKDGKGVKFSYVYDKPDLINYLNELSAYTGMRLRLFDNRNTVYQAEAKKYKHIPNLLLFYLEDFNTMVHNSTIERLYKFYDFDNSYDRDIKNKAYVPHDDRGGRNSPPEVNQTLSGTALHDLKDYDFDYDYAFAQGIYMELIGKVNREVYDYPTIQRKYEQPLREPYALMSLDKYLLCAMYSKNVPVGGKILYRNRIINLRNEIVYLQQLNKENK